MKSKFTFLILFIFPFFLFAQGEGPVKGEFMIETGFSIFSGLGFGGGSGIGAQFGGDLNGSITSIGIEGGYFIADNLALKTKIALFAVDGVNVTNLSIGGKYYIISKIPVELNAGLISVEGESAFLGSLAAGYAIGLAPNIYLEPSLGIFVGEGASFFNFDATFVMFF